MTVFTRKRLVFGAAIAHCSSFNNKSRSPEQLPHIQLCAVFNILDVISRETFFLTY